MVARLGRHPAELIRHEGFGQLYVGTLAAVE